MDGVECTKRIREKYGGSWPYIVTVTTDVFPGMFHLDNIILLFYYFII
jgi:hypothetical protein